MDTLRLITAGCVAARRLSLRARTRVRAHAGHCVVINPETPETPWPYRDLSRPAEPQGTVNHGGRTRNNVQTRKHPGNTVRRPICVITRPV